MNGTIKPPDFDDMLAVADEIKELTFEKLSLESVMKEAESNVVLEVTSNPDYYRDGKVPAMNFIDSTYKVTGLNGEISAIRKQLAETTSNLDYQKRKFEILTGMLNAWQTESANLRSATL